MPHEPAGVVSLAKEYQDYVVGHRVRGLLGGRLAPPPLLSLPEYASKRLERQRLARELVTTRPLTPERIRAVDRLTDELNFGLWRNPLEVADFLRAAWRCGGHPVLESEAAFARQVLEPAERARLPGGGLPVARYYHACLGLAATALDPDGLERVARRVEALGREVPLFLAAFHGQPL